MLDSALRDILVEGAARMGISLGKLEVDHFAAHLELLQLWGKKINLTTRIESREIIIYHFLDSLAGVRFLRSTPEAAVVDLGAGAGFPAFPLKIVLPGLQVLLVESTRKKITFCQEVLRRTGIAGVETAWGRGEELGLRPKYHRQYSVAVSRAFGRSADVVRLAIPFLDRGGRVVLFKGAPAADELLELDRLCSNLGASLESHPVSIPFLDAARSLVVIQTAA